MNLPWPLSRDPLARLLQRARAGDSRAFGELYDALYPRVWVFVTRRSATAADAEDAAARTFHRLLERLDRYDAHRGPVAAFVFAIARNLLADDARSRRQQGPGRSDRSDEDELHDAVPDALGQLVRAEELEALREALAKLPGETRELFGLRYGDGLRAPEIAALLGLSDAAVRQRLSRALHALQELLPPEWDTGEEA